MRQERVRQAVGLSAVAFGAVGSLAPRLLARTLGVRTDTGEFTFLTRFAMIEDLGLGINLLLAKSEEIPRLLALAAAIDGTICLLAVRGGLAGTLSRRTALMLAATAGGVAVLAGSQLIQSGAPPDPD